MPAEDERVEEPPTEPGESLVLTYVVPFFGVMLIAVGLSSAILGGYVVMQDSFGLCNDPDVEVRAIEDGDPPGRTVDRIAFEDLSSAEQRAVEEATTSTLEEARVEGQMENREALLEGAIVEVDGEPYYVRIASQNSCLEAEPLLFPLGSVAVLLGIAGVLTPPIYRKMAGFEERMHRGRGGNE
ncbi:hypothetical protein ACFQGT_08570 [Natrialbaceae archaeon GCM10025810]|uniref:hypothetical protein n=1 Tax=Halovalidus salilacus TaxID=3075124 RepID=UPI00361E4F9B